MSKSSFFIITLVAMCSLSLMSCNTFAGIGKDLSIIGNKMTSTAQGKVFRSNVNDAASTSYQVEEY